MIVCANWYGVQRALCVQAFHKKNKRKFRAQSMLSDIRITIGKIKQNMFRQGKSLWILLSNHTIHHNYVKPLKKHSINYIGIKSGVFLCSRKKKKSFSFLKNVSQYQIWIKTNFTHGYILALLKQTFCCDLLLFKVTFHEVEWCSFSKLVYFLNLDSFIKSYESLRATCEKAKMTRNCKIARCLKIKLFYLLSLI